MRDDVWLPNVWHREVWTSAARAATKNLSTALRFYMDEDGVAFPSLALLAKGDRARPQRPYMSTSKRALERTHVPQAEGDRWLYVDRHERHGRGDVNIYVATWPREWKGVDLPPFRAVNLALSRRAALEKLHDVQRVTDRPKGVDSTRKGDALSTKGVDSTRKGDGSTPEVVLKQLQKKTELELLVGCFTCGEHAELFEQGLAWCQQHAPSEAAA
jgi:hypothetical protein